MILIFPLRVASLLVLPLIVCAIDGREDNYNEILKSLKHQDSLIFDISTSLENQFEKIRDRKHVFNVSKVWLTPIINYSWDGSISSDMEEHQDIRNILGFHWGKLSFILDRQFIHSLSSDDQNEGFISIPNLLQDFVRNNRVHSGNRPKIILNIRDTNLSASLEGANGQVPLANVFLSFKKLWDNIPIGLEFTFNDMTYQNNSLLKLMEQVDLLILNQDISLDQFIQILSYSKFKAYLRTKLDPILEDIYKVNPNCAIYVKMNFAGEDTNDNMQHLKGSNGQLYEKYYYYLLQFSVLWLNEGKREKLILSTFHSHLAIETGFQGAKVRDLVTVPIFSRLWDLKGSCEKKALLEHASSNFKTVTLDGLNLKAFQSIDYCILTNDYSNCSMEQLESKICSRPMANSSTVQIKVNHYTNSIFMTFEEHRPPQIQKSLNGLTWKLIDIFLAGDGSFIIKHDAGNLYRFQTDLQELSPSVKIACRHYWRGGIPSSDNQFFSAIHTSCDFIWNQTNIIVWGITINTDVDLSDLARTLLGIEMRRRQFIKQYPTKSIMLHVKIRLDDNAAGVGNREPHNFYCHPIILQKNELAEIVINFAKVNGIPSEFREVLEYPQSALGGWQKLRMADELNVLKTKFPVFIARDYPENFLLGEVVTDPCITWTREPPKEGILIDTKFSGTTIYLAGVKNGSLLLNELHNLLVFAFHKFTLVELVPCRVSDLKALYEILSRQKLVDKILDQKTTSAQLYINIGKQFYDNAEMTGEISQFVNNLEDVIMKPAGIHFTNLKSRLLPPDNLAKGLQYKQILYGLSLDDCVEEVNANLKNLGSHPHIFNQVDYILCNIKKPREASNVDKVKVEKYLDTTLYIRKYFQRMFPNASQKEILYRLNTHPSSKDYSAISQIPPGQDEIPRTRTSNFLAFFNDVSKYGSAYKMKFFMLPAFDDSVEMGKQFGWWRISDYERLASPSVFIEKQAEHLNLTMWRPTEEPEGEPFEKSLIILGLIVLVTILFISTILLVFRYRRQYSFLSKGEVDEFRNGIVKMENDNGSVTALFDGRKFPKKFEIPTSRIILLNIIGQGNFGLVYKANLLTSETSDEEIMPVAIKLPNPGFTKESFKSMLSELKVLCYVGSHPNVLEFVGAHIKEIGRGMVYIATELCEGGALQEYLRNINSERAGTIDSQRPPINTQELYRFALEIANGMEYIASKNVIHGDLSARNVLLTLELQCKIGDFGLSRKLYGRQEYVKKGQEELPWRWLSLESLRKKEFSTKSDVWSYGVTLWEIFSLGAVPYPALCWTDEFLEKLDSGYRMSAPKYSDTTVYDMIVKCWEANPVVRPDFTELCQFFDGLRTMDYACQMK